MLRAIIDIDFLFRIFLFFFFSLAHLIIVSYLYAGLSPGQTAFSHLHGFFPHSNFILDSNNFLCVQEKKKENQVKENEPEDALSS